jgi:hypothetical protein
MNNLQIPQAEWSALNAATNAFIKTWPDFYEAINYFNLVSRLNQPEIESNILDYLELNYASETKSYFAECNINYEGED